MKEISTKRHKQKIFIVDDHPMIRSGLAQLINQETDLTVCGEAGDIRSSMEAIPECSPDVVIVDLSLGQESGIRLIEDLLLRQPSIKILVLSMHDESFYAERCFKAGARGYVMKQEPPEKVLLAVKKVLKGELYLSDKLSSKLLNKFVTKNAEVRSSPVEWLSNRELEVFQLIGKGIKTSKIAEQLNLSIKTIETHMDHIKKKLNISDSRTLIMQAVQWAMSEESRIFQTDKPADK